MWRNDDRIMDILDKYERGTKECFPAACPVCGKKDAHLYAHRFKEEENQGGEWAWCSACHNCVHVSARLPKWWKNLNKINFNKLASIPDYLEENKVCIDEWANYLFFSECPEKNEKKTEK